MNPRATAALCVLVAALNGCSGGGGGGASATPPLPMAAPQNATGTLTIDRPATNSVSSTRKPAYVSASTTYASLWIDGSASATRVACSTAQCAINWNTTPGAHTFAVAVDDSTSIAGGGHVLADNSEQVTVTAGTNTLANLTLKGVVAAYSFISQTRYPAGSTSCTQFEGYGANYGYNCYLGSFAIDDADGNIITNTTAGTAGSFDDYGACVGPTNVGGDVQGFFYFASSAASGCTYTIGDPTVTNGDDTSFIATCNVTISFAFTFGVVGESDGAALNLHSQPGEISAQQLSTYALVYPSQTYTMQNFPTYSCSGSGTIS